MSVEFRPLRPDELHEAVYAGRIGFGQSTAAAEVDAWIARHAGVEGTLAAVEDGAIAAQVMTLPLSVYWNGPTIACGGVTAVNTLPTHRRRGYVRELLTRSLAQMHEAGQPVSLLWATMAAIYQRFGYGVAFVAAAARFDPRRLAFVDAVEPPGRLRLIALEPSLPLLAPVYERFAALRTPMLCRDEHAWDRHRSRIAQQEQHGRPPYLAAVYEEGGEVLGYTVYEVASPQSRPAGRQQITVYELVWLSPAAHRALIQMFAAYDLAESVQFASLPIDDPLFWQVQEPRDLQMQIGDGAMLRVVDVAAALEGRGYDADGRVTFLLDDPLCPWNSGGWEIEAEEGVARVRRTSAEPELRLTPRVLALVACGCQPATALARMGLLAASGERALRTADALFRMACAPFCMDRF
jgi:predicted acetyltransferase